MDRKDFVKLMGIGAGSLLVSGLGVNAESLKYDLKMIKIYDNYVRGVNFRRKDFLSTSLKKKDTIQLEREADNKYDRFAIKVKKDEKFLGYIAAYENIVMAMLMDQGVKLEARVSEIREVSDKEEYLDNVLSIEVFTKILVPYNHVEANDLRTKRADDADDLYRQRIL